MQIGYMSRGFLSISNFIYVLPQTLCIYINAPTPAQQVWGYIYFDKKQAAYK